MFFSSPSARLAAVKTSHQGEELRRSGETKAYALFREHPESVAEKEKDACMTESWSNDQLITQATAVLAVEINLAQLALERLPVNCHPSFSMYAYAQKNSRIQHQCNQRRNIMTYYRVAFRDRQTATWIWRTTVITSLQAVFQQLRRYSAMPQDRVRVFMASSPEEMHKQLAQENNGLGSHSVTAAHFLQERMLTLQQDTSHAGALRPSSNESGRESYTREESALRTLERKQQKPEHRIHQGDFWNLSALVAA